MLVSDPSLVSDRRLASPGWRARLAGRVVQHPLIESRPSLEGIAAVGAAPPRALMIGVGLCTERRLSAGVPLDVLGLLLPAEALRRALGARRLVVLVADVHARLNRLDAAAVERRAAEALDVLARVRRAFGLQHLDVVRAAELHDRDEYRSILAEVERRAPSSERPYVKRQLADVEYFHRRLGGLLKVGWSISPSSRARHAQDERYFDGRHRAVLGGRVGFVYCKPGRVLDDERRKAPPYVTLDARRRVCLHPDEDAPAKLAAARRFASRATVNGVRNHLRAVTRAFCELSDERLSGPVEARVQELIARVFAAD